MSTVLVVDDDDILRDAVCEFLSMAGHTPLCAANGQAALDVLQQGGVDLLITDVVMPGISGFRFVSMVRKAHPSLPILAISGGGRQLNSEFTLGSMQVAGVNAVLSKPFSRVAFLDKVAALIGDAG